MKNILLASASVVLVVFIFTFLATVTSSTGYQIGVSFVISGVSAVVALIVVIFWAIPIHLIFKKLNIFKPAWYVVSAIIPSFVFIYAFKPFGNDTSSDLLIQALFCSLAGGLGALSFWYLAVYRLKI